MLMLIRSVQVRRMMSCLFQYTVLYVEKQASYGMRLRPGRTQRLAPPGPPHSTALYLRFQLQYLSDSDTIETLVKYG